MKKLLFIVLTALLLTSCKDYQEYSIAYRQEVPDNCKVDYRDMIESLTEKGNPANLATNRSKDFGQIINAASRAAFSTYAVTVEQLEICSWEDGNYQSRVYIRESELTPDLRIWFDSCKVVNTTIRVNKK